MNLLASFASVVYRTSYRTCIILLRQTNILKRTKSLATTTLQGFYHSLENAVAEKQGFSLESLETPLFQCLQPESRTKYRTSYRTTVRVLSFRITHLCQLENAS